MNAPVDPTPPSDPSSGGRWGRRSRSQGGPFPWVPAILVVVLLGGAAWWWFGLRSPEEAAGPGAVTPVAPAVDDTLGVDTPGPAPLDLPPLTESDPVVRRVVGVLSSHPRWAEWLVTDDLIVRFVSSVANVAAGASPAPQVPFLAPEGNFQVAEAGGATRIDPESYRRYDLLTEAFVSFDTRAAVDLFQQLLPLFDEAHRSLGFPEGTFGGAFDAAVDNVLAVEVPETPPAVELDVQTYLFTDESLEAMSPAAKQVMRIGPDNARRVQSKLRELRDGLVRAGVVPAR